MRKFSLSASHCHTNTFDIIMELLSVVEQLETLLKGTLSFLLHGDLWA